MPGTDRLPAVVLVHGSGGISSYVEDWSTFLNSMGVATFILDCFTPRGIESLTDDKAPLSWLTMTFDAFRALDELARHRRIDPARIAVFGFSIGGHASLYASLKRFRADAWLVGSYVRGVCRVLSAVLTEYPGAFHMFDWTAVKVPTRFPHAQSARGCRIEEAADGRLVHAETNRPFTWADPCVERGGTFGYDVAAHEKAKKAVAELVRTVLIAK